MKQKLTFLLLTFAFVSLFAGAYLLYNNLSQTAEHDQLAVIYGQTANQPSEELPPESVEPQISADSKETDSSEVKNIETKTDTTQQEQAEPEYTAAPDFTVYDIDGNEVHLSDYIGKPIVLNFWASWCSACKSQMPDFNDAYAELGEEVQFLMVNGTFGRETVESASEYIEEKGYSFPIVYDTNTEASMAYGAFSLPTTYFIDTDGFVIAQAIGAIGRKTLQKGIDMITSE